MTRGFSTADEGKWVVTADGEVVGRVAHIDGGRAYVRPRPGLLRGLGSWLTGTWGDERAYPLDPEAVDRVGERKIVLAGGVRETPAGRT